VNDKTTRRPILMLEEIREELKKAEEKLKTLRGYL
jgi:hypothetical protein